MDEREPGDLRDQEIEQAPAPSGTGAGLLGLFLLSIPVVVLLIDNAPLGWSFAGFGTYVVVHIWRLSGRHARTSAQLTALLRGQSHLHRELAQLLQENAELRRAAAHPTPQAAPTPAAELVLPAEPVLPVEPALPADPVLPAEPMLPARPMHTAEPEPWRPSPPPQPATLAERSEPAASTRRAGFTPLHDRKEEEAPRTPAPPAGPARPPFDWEAAWRVLAGPLGGGERPHDVASAEAHIGTVWFSRIGALLLIIGGIFAFRYGVTSDALRVLIGYVAGLGLLGLGYWGNRKDYRIWAQAITGGGLGLLYLTTTAAATFFDVPVLAQPVAFALMILITALATGLAVYYDSLAVGLLGMVGGFATPFLLSNGAGDFRVLFGYIAILDAGLLLVAYFKRWPLYNYLTFLATWGIYGLWRTASFHAADGPWAFVFASLFFLIFALVAITYNIVHRQQSRYQDLGLVLVNGFVYFGSGLDLLSPGYAVLRGFFAFAVAAAYFGLGWLTLVRNRQDRLLLLSFLGLSGIFLTLAFPVALSGPWITVAWALEGAALTWVGFYAGASEARYGALSVLALAALRLAVWDTFPGAFGAPLAAPALRAFTFLVGAAAFYLAAWAYARFRADQKVLGALAVAGNLFTLWYVTLEIALHYSGTPGADASLALAVAAAWGLYGLAVALADLWFRHPGVRSGARVVLGAALTGLVLGAMLGGGSGPAPAWLRTYGYLGVLGSIWAGEWLIRRRGLDGGSNGILSLVAGVVAFGLLPDEVTQQLRPVFALPIGQRLTPVLSLWRDSVYTFTLAACFGAYALITMAAGVWLRSSAARLLAGALAGITMVYVAAAGVPNLAAPAALRAGAFALVVGGTYLATFLASRARGGRPGLEVELLGSAALSAALLTAWWGAAEIFARFDVRPGDPGAPAFAVLAWLGLYALAVGRTGVWLRAPAARWLALVLQGMALLGLLFGTAQWTAPWPFQLVTFVALILGVYAAHRLFATAGRPAAEVQTATWLSLAACALTMVWLGFAVHRGFESGVPAALRNQAQATANHWVVLAMGLYGLAVVGAGLWLRSLHARALGLGIAALAVAASVTVLAAASGAPLPLRLAAFAAAAGAVYAAAWLVRRFAGRATGLERTATEWLALGTGALTVLWLTFEVQAYFAPFLAAGTRAQSSFARSTASFGVSAAWGVYGFVVLTAGFVLRHRWTRLLGLAVLVLTLGKIGVDDMWRLALIWRIWITVGLGVLLLVASFIYQRFPGLVRGDADERGAGA